MVDPCLFCSDCLIWGVCIASGTDQSVGHDWTDVRGVFVSECDSEVGCLAIGVLQRGGILAKFFREVGLGSPGLSVKHEAGFRRSGKREETLQVLLKH